MRCREDGAWDEEMRELIVRGSGSGENRRRDNEEDAPAENEEVNEEEAVDHPEFELEAVVDKATLQGESGSDGQFFDAQVEVEEPVAKAQAVPAFLASPGDSSNQQKEAARVDPSGPSGHILDSIII
ncbi:hypothetical protein Dimus_001319 [Dionaea muscipula]